MSDIQGFSIPLNATDPLPRFAVLIGRWEVKTDISDEIPDVEWSWDEMINLSERHQAELMQPSPVSPKRARVTAAVGLESINNMEASQWTWEVTAVQPFWDGIFLKLRVTLTAQGGPSDPPGVPIIANIAYHVTVVVQ